MLYFLALYGSAALIVILFVGVITTFQNYLTKR